MQETSEKWRLRLVSIANCITIFVIVFSSSVVCQYQQQPQQMPHQAAPQAGGHMHGQMYGQPQASGVQSTNNPNLLHDSSRIQDKEHMSHHFGGVLSEPDLSKMSEEELQFYYFKMHDNDNNNKLDGSELIKSLIHWHVEESKQLGQPKGTTKLFTDAELVQMIDPILEMDDRNGDGYIDYPEFIAAQKHRRML